MARRRIQLLTTDNAQGNGTPAVADLVAVQNNVINWLSDFRTEMREMLREGREDHQREHAEFRRELVEWRAAEVLRCAALMAPYASLGLVARAFGWADKHQKATGLLLSGAVAAAAIIGGLILPGR